VLSSLRETLPGIRAFLLLGADGRLLDSSAAVSEFDIPSLASEFATLLRIIEHSSVDAGMGDLREQIFISSVMMTLVQHLPKGRFAIFLCSPDEHLGRLRYELRRSLLYSSLSNYDPQRTERTY
jgi:predicted regulator of Ras-like GTPase activity (Roadblock/LC7/MglB family)